MSRVRSSLIYSGPFFHCSGGHRPDPSYSRVAATECSPTRQRGDPVDLDFPSSVERKMVLKNLPPLAGLTLIATHTPR